MKLNFFNFKKINNKFLLTNDFGQYIFVTEKELNKLINHDFSFSEERLEQLTLCRMIYDESDLAFSSDNRYDLRNAKGHVQQSTSLHIFVVTTCCNLRCVYCQANNGINNPTMMMDISTAKKAVDVALQSPTKYLSFEFQGGEPLVNFDIIKYIFEYSEEHKGHHEINYNIVTNLTLLNDEITDFIKKNKIGVSTSLDGNRELHNINRPFPYGTGSYDSVCKSVIELRSEGIHVGAIQTTTRESLNYPEQIVDTYKDLGFDSVFIRPLTPLGKATKNWESIGYTAKEYLEFYEKVLNRILDINKAGLFFKEAHASILLKRIFGQFVNYMELRSPCGATIGQMAYYPDGNVFTCDEGRMFYEMGDKTFCLGSVYNNTYKEMICSSVCKAVCASSVLETIPSCCDCVYQIYCGTCPVVNFANCGDLIEKNPRGYRCSIYMGMLDLLFDYFERNDNKVMDIFRAWSN